jgi:hypothetical protein
VYPSAFCRACQLSVNLFTHIHKYFCNLGLSCASSASQPALCRRHRGLPLRGFPCHHPQVSVGCVAVEGMRNQSPLPEEAASHRLVAVSGASVGRGTSLITLHLRLPSRVQNSSKCLEGVLPFFFLRRQKPPGDSSRRTTDQSVGGHPTYTDTPTCRPRLLYPSKDGRGFTISENLKSFGGR